MMNFPNDLGVSSTEFSMLPVLEALLAVTLYGKLL
jgi:hypothetical protein